MISFQKIPQAKLNIKTGVATGINDKPKELPNIGMPTSEFHKQIIDLVNKKIPLDKAYHAIDHHPDITDKKRAKSMAGAVYGIIGNK